MYHRNWVSILGINKYGTWGILYGRWICSLVNEYFLSESWVRMEQMSKFSHSRNKRDKLASYKCCELHLIDDLCRYYFLSGFYDLIYSNSGSNVRLIYHKPILIGLPWKSKSHFYWFIQSSTSHLHSKVVPQTECKGEIFSHQTINYECYFWFH